MEVIDISRWGPDEEYPVFGQGSREKGIVVCPKPPPLGQLVSGHRYLFKRPIAWQPSQYWSEVVAGIIARQAGIDVPPVYVAVDSGKGLAGALIEWFYGYPGEGPVRYVSGGDYMKRLIDDYDLKHGRQHNFRTLSTYFRLLEQGGLLDDSWVLHWARVFMFDALIGNTDRHHDNWGLLWNAGGAKLAPAFDNGTSLGYEILEENLNKFRDIDRIVAYVRRGTHHMRWEGPNATKSNHAELVAKYVERFPHVREVLLEMVSFQVEQLENELTQASCLDVPGRLTAARMRFILDLTEYRRQNLLSLVA